MMVQAFPPAVPKGKKALLARLVAASGDVNAIDDAVAVLGMSRKATVQQLSRWGEQGWLNRVGPGRYVLRVSCNDFKRAPDKASSRSPC